MLLTKLKAQLTENTTTKRTTVFILLLQENQVKIRALH